MRDALERTLEGHSSETLLRHALERHSWKDTFLRHSCDTLLGDTKNFSETLAVSLPGSIRTVSDSLGRHSWDTLFRQMIKSEPNFLSVSVSFQAASDSLERHSREILVTILVVPPSTTSYYKARTTYFPVPLCTTKLAQSTSQYYFVLQSLHEVLPSTTLYHKACAKYFPVLLWTTKLAHNTTKYCFVPQSLHTTLATSC